MKTQLPKVGVTELEGTAVCRLQTLKDDNHSLPADEQAALENFDTYSKSFFDVHHKFIGAAKE